MVRELEVWLFRDRVGTLGMVDGRVSFQYTPAWLQRSDALALSASLPLRVDAFADREARPFFAGLLPEGQLRRLLAQQFQVSTHNDFALLNLLGGECAGAVTLRASGASGPLPDEVSEVQWLDDDALVAVLDELPRRPMLAGHDGLRLSLAGAQDKLPVVFDGTRIGLPRHGTPSSHILKPAIHAIEDSVINEAFCMALAERMRLQPAKASAYRVRDRGFLLVERYDRAGDAQGHRRRLHQEDFCQALGVVPEMKYQNEGGPDLARCFNLLRSATRPSAPHLLRLFDCVVFNALIGNHDAHAKNFSLLHPASAPDSAAVLAPFYDILCTAVYPTLTPGMAMKIGSKYTFSEVRSRHWVQFAEQAGVSKAQARRRILELATQLPVLARELQADAAHGFSGNALVAQIVGLIEQRCGVTVVRMGEAGEVQS